MISRSNHRAGASEEWNITPATISSIPRATTPSTTAAEGKRAAASVPPPPATAAAATWRPGTRSGAETMKTKTTKSALRTVGTEGHR
ncbi:hypothetical protein [Microbispora sp. H10949]|uniref:hypothetical protein n=1 Tax=Microbispora sp. H10949 TaxID=2729111 RepID=UPI001601AD48|nr:hypothetical protein [Microbispora sp. H10949]